MLGTVSYGVEVAGDIGRELRSPVQSDCRQSAGDYLSNPWKCILKHGDTSVKQLFDRLFDVAVRLADFGQQICPRGFCGRHRAFDCRRGLTGCGTGYLLFFLNLLDCLHDVGKAVDGQVARLAVRLTPLVRVVNETLHLLLGSAVAELEVVEHRVILFGKAVEGVGDVLGRRAEGVDVVAHSTHGDVGHIGGFLSVPAQAVN